MLTGEFNRCTAVISLRIKGLRRTSLYYVTYLLVHYVAFPNLGDHYFKIRPSLDRDLKLGSITRSFRVEHDYCKFATDHRNLFGTVAQGSVAHCTRVITTMLIHHADYGLYAARLPALFTLCPNLVSSPAALT
jgi:hypothetical protein